MRGQTLTNGALENSERGTAQCFSQYVAEMRFPVVVQRIQQVLDVYAGFRVTFNTQPAAEKKRIRVFAPGGELPEIFHFPADAHVGAAWPGRPQLPFINPEMDLASRVLDVDAHGFSVDFRQPCGQPLAAQQVVEYPREQFRVHGVGD